MPQTRPNKATTPVNSDAYNLPTDLATMADSLTVCIIVADATDRDSKTVLNGQLCYRLDTSQVEAKTASGWFPISPSAGGTPYAISSGTVTVNVTSGTNFSSASIVFPAGRFSQTPKLMVSMSNAPSGSQSFVPRSFTQSTSGATVAVYHGNFSGGGTAPSTFGVGVDWVAVQMTSTSAAG